MTVSGPAAFLGALARKLGEAEIPWMLTGSMASSFYGEPRATNDLDVVLDPDEAQLGRFLASLAGTFYVGAEEAREALHTRGMFNVIDSASGWKADLILLKERAFDREEFRRGRPVRLFDVDVYVISPEGSILSKLEWARQGNSDLQLRDARAVAASCGASLDREYLRRQAEALGLKDELVMILPPP